MATEPEDPKAKLDAKDISGRCEACGETRWSISKDRFSLTKLDASNTLTSTGLPVHAVICDNCGFVRLFHADLL
jgi:hypothetical protein